jgi:hypothetical protein
MVAPRRTESAGTAHDKFTRCIQAKQQMGKAELTWPIIAKANLPCSFFTNVEK